MFVAQPRLVDLVLAPDGTRLIALAQTINHEGTGYTPGLWEVDLSGAREMRLVAESAQGAFAPAFAADGTLLFLSGRELPDYSETESVSWGPSLRALSEQGEVELVARHSGGISAFTAAKEGGMVAYTAALMPGAADAEEDAERRRQRKSAGVNAILYGASATRAWGSALGPDEPHTFVQHSDGRCINLGGQGLGGGEVTLSPDGSLVAYTLTAVHAEADDGFPLRAWLVLPEGASAERPAPLIVVPHGGPQASWSAWAWLWNPWPLAARGYAVLLPDPALSTGYGQRMQERGRGQYGGQPYRDVIALTDAALARDDLDAARTGLAGWSFGGYLANLAASLTDRFKGIVSHAGMWNLEAFQAETDLHPYYHKIFGDPRTQRERYEASSPHLDAAKVTTPMLIVHGGKDYRVPVGQALGLHNDLKRSGVPVSFLYLPDESHGIESPNHVHLMYETVLNFFDHHVLGLEWRKPALL
jgi:dipeptidyl aminopeptidase/acylaminoacyl peptidase